MKRARATEDTGEVPTPQLFFVSAQEDGFPRILTIRPGSTDKMREISDIFDTISREIDAAGNAHDSETQHPWIDEIPMHLALYYIEEVTAGNALDERYLKKTQEMFSKIPDLNFPFHWTKKEWGILEFPNDSITVGKHYVYDSWN